MPGIKNNFCVYSVSSYHGNEREKMREKLKNIVSVKKIRVAFN